MGKWLFGILTHGCKWIRKCRWRRTCHRRLQKSACLILVSCVFYLAVVSLPDIHFSGRRSPDKHMYKKHTVKTGFVRLKNKVTTGKEDDTYEDNTFQVSEDALIPNNATLNSMSGAELTSLYYRYVNSLQFLCPVKDIFGGILNGIYSCQLPKQATKCHAVYISKKLHGESRILTEIRHTRGCSVRLILKDDVEVALRDGSMDLRRTFLKAVDILIIHATSGEAYITERLLSRGYLGKVQQLIVKIRLTRGATDPVEVKRRLALLKSLYREGFRIYHKEPGIKCIYRRWYTYCYTIYMVRPQPVTRPIVIPEVTTLSGIAQEDLFRLYHRFAVSTQTLCSDNVRVGHIKDGGWNICNDKRYRPVPPCIVYSFGISDDWTFDDQISKIWKCKVHSFDPSIGKKDFNRSAKISFHNLGIDGKDSISSNNWQMRTLDSVMSLLGHTQKIIDIVKMDVEGSEWPALNQILDSGVLAKVRQLFIEFHTYDTWHLKQIKHEKRISPCVPEEAASSVSWKNNGNLGQIWVDNKGLVSRDRPSGMVNGTLYNNDTTNALEVTRFLCDVILFLIIVVGIISNICVCLCICRNRHLRTYLNVNIVSSCVGNIIGCAFLLPIRIGLYTSFSNDSDTWMLCRVGTFFRTFCDTLQLFMFTTASFERYQAVAHPFKKSGLQKRSAFLVVLSWTIALSLGTISALVLNDSALYMPCAFLQESVTWTDYDAYLIAPLGSTLIFIIIVFYTLIVKTLFKHSDVMIKYKKKNTSKVSPGVSGLRVKDSPRVTKDIAVSTNNVGVKQTSSQCPASSDILRKGSHEKQKITPVSSCDLKILIANNSTGNAQRTCASLPDITPTSCNNTVQVVGMDGSVRITKTSNEHIAGAVCLMTSNNRQNGRRRVELRAAKKIAILIGTFICCWLPLPVFVISYRLSGQISLSETLICLLMIFGVVGCSSVVVNPILLGLIHRQLNSALKQLLKIEKMPCCS